MLNRHFLNSFLKVNNSAATMSDTDVSEVLTKAGWSRSEIDSALILLNNNGAAGSAAKEEVRFRPDMEFSSGQLSSLLGVDVKIDPNALRSNGMTAVQVRSMTLQVFFACATIILSLALAAGVAIASVHYLEIGPFAK